MKTLVVTGASKGIGFAIAELFLDDGFRVINLSRTPAPDDGIQNFHLDLSLANAEEEVNDLISKILEQEEICLVHNAAKMTNDIAQSTETAKFQDVLNINVIAAHILNQAIIPLMKPGSSVIYIGSTLSEKAVSNTYSYVVSKHALIGMMRATCQDLKGMNIHTSCICPGFTDTEMLRAHVAEDREVINTIASTSTFGRLVSPSEIAATVQFAARHPVINGAVLHANLGQIEN